jgi:hypothetical protein
LPPASRGFTVAAATRACGTAGLSNARAGHSPLALSHVRVSRRNAARTQHARQRFVLAEWWKDSSTPTCPPNHHSISCCYSERSRSDAHGPATAGHGGHLTNFSWPDFRYVSNIWK